MERQWPLDGARIPGPGSRGRPLLRAALVQPGMGVEQRQGRSQKIL